MSKIEVNAIEPQCGTTLTIGASDTSIAGIGTVNWDTTAKTAAFTAVSGRGYFVNTTSGAITATLPAGSAGAIVAFADYANTFDTNKLTISPNGTDKIGGTNADAGVSTEGASTTFVYVDSTQGWKQVNDATLNTIGENFITATGGTITTSGNCKIHTFTSPGTFCVSAISSSSTNNIVSYMVVAGGGGGGSGYQAGGGGAGGFREYKSPVTPYTASPLDGNPGGTEITVTATGFPITVGGGGAAGPCSPACGAKGSNGANSVFSTVTSAGGGGAGAFSPSAPITHGLPGGSGGGAGRTSSPSPAGSGNTPPVSPPQGKDGGAASTPYAHPYSGGGGGGATVGGTNSGGTTVGDGGNGATTSISGSSTTYAGGGGGGGYGAPSPSSTPSDSGDGGSGGGGKGAVGTVTAAVSGTANTGGGGGGSGHNLAPTNIGGTGGSGIVVIRYKFQ